MKTGGLEGPGGSPVLDVAAGYFPKIDDPVQGGVLVGKGGGTQPQTSRNPQHIATSKILRLFGSLFPPLREECLLQSPRMRQCGTPAWFPISSDIPFLGMFAPITAKTTMWDAQHWMSVVGGGDGEVLFARSKSKGMMVVPVGFWEAEGQGGGYRAPIVIEVGQQSQDPNHF